jgi:hypothetical protein
MSSIVKRTAYVCIQCEGVYMDEPVTECDCALGADIFWIADVSYKKLERRTITFGDWVAAHQPSSPNP